MRKDSLNAVWSVEIAKNSSVVYSDAFDTDTSDSDDTLVTDKSDISVKNCLSLVDDLTISEINSWHYRLAKIDLDRSDFTAFNADFIVDLIYAFFNNKDIKIDTNGNKYVHVNKRGERFLAAVRETCFSRGLSNYIVMRL